MKLIDADKLPKYTGFNHDTFYQWAVKQNNIFISEYNMPQPFIEISRINKTVLSGRNGVERQIIEKLYTNEQTYKTMIKELSLF